jgi:hypothetical protein
MEFMFWGSFSYDKKGPCHCWGPETKKERADSEKMITALNAQLSEYIDGWLNTFIAESTSPSCGQKRDAPSSPILSWGDMPTPPSSETPTRSRRRSPKRQRQDDTPEGNLQDAPFDEQTPTGPARRLVVIMRSHAGCILWKNSVVNYCSSIQEPSRSFILELYLSSRIFYALLTLIMM